MNYSVVEVAVQTVKLSEVAEKYVAFHDNQEEVSLVVEDALAARELLTACIEWVASLP